MADQLIKALAYQDQVRVFVVDATQAVAQAQQRHDTWHTATAALGRSLVATSLLAASLKGSDRLNIQIQGFGPLGEINCDGDSQGAIRGYVKHPHVALELNQAGKIDVSGAVGLPGNLRVRKLSQSGESFTGQVALVSGELAEDFTYYLAASEQIPSAVGLSVLVNPDETVASAGGFLIQVLPDVKEETLQAIETNLQSLGNLSEQIDQAEHLEELLAQLVGPDNYRVIHSQSIHFTCPCSKDRFAKAILALPPSDIQQMIEEDHQAEAVCHYCNESYHYTQEELEDLLDQVLHGE